MFRTIIHILVFLLALAPAAALAGDEPGKAHNKRVTRTHRAAGKVTLIRVNRGIITPRTMSAKGTKARAGSKKQPRRSKARRTTHRQAHVMVLRTSRPNTLVALGDALTGGSYKRAVKKTVLKKKAPRSRLVLVNHAPPLSLSGSLRDMASKLLPDSDLRKADLQLMRLED